MATTNNTPLNPLPARFAQAFDNLPADDLRQVSEIENMLCGLKAILYVLGYNDDIINGDPNNAIELCQHAVHVVEEVQRRLEMFERAALLWQERAEGWKARAEAKKANGAA